MSRRNSVWLPFILSIAVIIGLFAGYIIQGRYNTHSPQFINIGRTSKIDEIMGYIDQKYVDQVDDDELSAKAIADILSHLDPHSVYISRDEMNAVNEDMSGNFEGIGVEFMIIQDTIMVVSPLSGGPSEALGIQSGDRIIMIDDSLVAGIGVNNGQVMKMLKGPKGTEVKVGIKRSGKKELIDYTIKRDKIPIVSVDVGTMIDDQTGYIKVNRFSASTYQEFMEQLDELTNAGMTKLILDLRQNPGGYLDEATNILDEFIDGRKELVYTQGRQHPKFIYNARKPGMFEEGQIVVLIDEGSASASEIVAGSLQDWDRATIVGRRSFGKGLVQEQYLLSDGSALRLTVAKYYTPSGRCIQKPYDGGIESYEHDLLNRYDHGEFFAQDSSVINDSLVYYTKVERRKVFGGGGIMPDIFVPFDTTGYDTFFQEISARGLVPQFVYDYYAAHKSEWPAFADLKSFRNGFKVKGEIYNKFTEYARSEGVEVPTQVNQDTKSLIENRLLAYFAKQFLNGDGFYPVLLDDDKVFQAAKSAFERSSVE